MFSGGMGKNQKFVLSSTSQSLVRRCGWISILLSSWKSPLITQWQLINETQITTVVLQEQFLNMYWWRSELAFTNPATLEGTSLKHYCNTLPILVVPLACLTLSWRRPLLCRNQSIDLLCKSMDWFLYDNGPRHERVK